MIPAIIIFSYTKYSSCITHTYYETSLIESVLYEIKRGIGRRIQCRAKSQRTDDKDEDIE